MNAVPSMSPEEYAARYLAGHAQDQTEKEE